MTTQAGFGLCPMGVGPYGFGTPAATLPTTGAIFVDPKGNQQNGRRIDPVTKQYVYDANGNAVGASSAVQMMYLACTTDLGSSAISDLGNDLKTIKDIGADFQQRVVSVYTTATARLVARGIVAIRSITVQQAVWSGGTRATPVIKFTDLTTGKPEEITL